MPISPGLNLVAANETTGHAVMRQECRLYRRLGALGNGLSSGEQATVQVSHCVARCHRIDIDTRRLQLLGS